MTISYNWLSTYLPETVEAAELEKILTSVGLEVESMKNLLETKKKLEGLLIGEVVSCEKHPGADKLSLTRVFTGNGEPLQVVCGAPNVATGQKVVLAPPGAAEGSWQKKLEPYTDATASGWVQVRGNRRRQSLDRGFVISDHADYPGLLQAISATGAEKVICTHGFTALFSRQLRDMGIAAQEERTLFMGEGGADAQEEEA
jgi:hypothetical protein